MAESLDLSATLPAPTPLRRTAIVSFLWGTQSHHIVCVACSVRRAPDPETGQEIDWVHCQGCGREEVCRTKSVPTTYYLIPASYVVRITYGGRYTIAERKKSEDLGIFPPIHPAPDAALTVSQIREIITFLQVEEGVEAPLLYNNFVRDVSSRFEQALARIKAEHNFEYGTEFEIAICKTLRTILPQKYGVCRGYVVSAFGEKAGDDVVIYDRMRFPTLRALESDDFSCKEQVPIEAVYAYVEAKHSICIEGDVGNSFQKALTQVANVKMLCDRRQSVPLFERDSLEEGTRVPGLPETRNPAYGIIICRHIRLKSGDPILEDPKEIQRLLLVTRAQTLLAPDLCVFGKSNMFIPVVSAEESGRTWMPSPFFDPQHSKMHSSIVDGVGFGAGLSLLLWALDWIQLGTMPWPAILEDCIPPSVRPNE